jgi:dolichol-phosphate mannosyltransferase
MSAVRFSLIVPTFNERENVGPFTEAVHRALADIPHEVIIVDDDSPDLTWKAVEDLSRTSPWLRVVRRVGRRGLSSAVLEGFEAATAPVLGVMDADLSHDESILPKLIAAVEGGAELAVGSRRVPGGGATDWPWYRRVTSWGATMIAKALLNLSISDPMSGFFVMRRDLYERCKRRLEPTGYKILLEIYCKGRPQRVSEVPFIFRDRRQGYSKLSAGVMRDFVGMVLRLRRSPPSSQ